MNTDREPDKSESHGEAAITLPEPPQEEFIIAALINKHSTSGKSESLYYRSLVARNMQVQLANTNKNYSLFPSCPWKTDRGLYITPFSVQTNEFHVPA